MASCSGDVDDMLEGLGTMTLTAPPAVHVITSFNDDERSMLNKAFVGVAAIALDAEGVDLSRLGKISIVQIATPDHCFLLDVLDKEAADPLVVWLGRLLSDQSIVKVVHDCRMDADALYHHFNLDLANVHDTSVWHAELFSSPDKNLNDTLSASGLAPNEARDGSVYRNDPSFWATRPLTATMVDWASGDVSSMFSLQQSQLARPCSPSQRRRIEQTTALFLSWKSADVSFVTVNHPGSFIGRGGSNIRTLQRTTNTLIYSAPSATPGYSRRMFMVYYHDPQALRKVEQKARARNCL